jgi:hydrogenase maturation protein HypF
VNEKSFERFAHFRTFRLPGGDAAVKQPRRSAVGLLFEVFGEKLFARRELALLRHFSQTELRMLQRMLAGGINSPVTSSAGRLFDAVAAIVGLRLRVNFEGQAAMELEFASADAIEDVYSFEIQDTAPKIFDWEPMIHEILDDVRANQQVGVIAAKFHNTLAEVVVAVAQAAGEKNVVLSGGCFQNCYLTERIIRRLREKNFVPHWHRRIPPNDGGIALGQIFAALRSEVRAHAKVGSKPDGSAGEIAPQLAEPISGL